MPELDEFDRRIVAALQANARAPWRTIAAALGEHERAVARRGAELLADQRVSVVGIRPHPAALLVRGRCSPGSSLVSVESLAGRSDTSFTYAVTGSSDVVAEVLTYPERLGNLLALELATTPGLSGLESFPILKYFRTIRDWRLDVLTPAQLESLRPRHQSDGMFLRSTPEMSPSDLDIVGCLTRDGRMGYEEIARRAGVSETTARRRVDWLLQNEHVHLRALVEPSLVGLPVEALLWLRVAPHRVEEIGQAFGRDRRVRYAAALAGSSQIMVDVTLPSTHDLYTFVTEGAWASGIESMDISLVVRARKRGGRITPAAATAP
ncbi:Lrp/AsnC family transcriptional regulator [Arthrobacter halodurans]|uniref:Lrp/AsnC family transcriptional regulator n=1 Tax=Arthrobacter halodurans TaxID=516699 RepID=A0ABV4UTM8_9MICC